MRRVTGAVESLTRRGQPIGPSTLQLGLSACGGGGSSGPPNYTLTGSTLSPSSLTPGNTSTSTISVASANGYAGSVTLSCSVTNAGTPAPRCSLSPTAVTIVSGNSAIATLPVSTSSNTPGGNYTISVAAVGADNLAPSNGPLSLTLSAAAVIEHVVAIFQENRTPDNLFQDPVLISRGADIATSGLDSLGQTIALTPIDLGTIGRAHHLGGQPRVSSPTAF